MTRADLHRLVDALPDESIDSAAVALQRARDPLWAALQAAPIDDEPLSIEDIEAIDEGRGGPGVTLEEIRAETA